MNRGLTREQVGSILKMGENSQQYYNNMTKFLSNYEIVTLQEKKIKLIPKREVNE